MYIASGLTYIQQLSISATANIEKLRQVFATHGLPDMVVSDNGKGFASEEFRDFMIKSGFPSISTQGRHKFKIWFRSFLAYR